MDTVTQHTTETLEVKRSKFIAHLFPYEQFDAQMAQLREAHPKARHFVTGYRYLNELDQIVEGCSDDGEPKGTSGKPTLAVLQGSEMINVGIITVRYFGGVKLGTGGLVRAYGDAVNLVLGEAALVPYEKQLQCRIACDYATIGMVEYTLEQQRVRALEKQFETDEVLWHLGGTKQALDAVLQQLGRSIRVITAPES